MWNSFDIDTRAMAHGEVMTRGSSLLTLGSSATYVLENGEFNWKRLHTIDKYFSVQDL